MDSMYNLIYLAFAAVDMHHVIDVADVRTFTVSLFDISLYSLRLNYF